MDSIARQFWSKVCLTCVKHRHNTDTYLILSFSKTIGRVSVLVSHRSITNINKCMYVPVSLLSLVKCFDIVLIVLLIINLDFSCICLLSPSSKTGSIVLHFPTFMSLMISSSCVVSPFLISITFFSKTLNSVSEKTHSIANMPASNELMKLFVLKISIFLFF